MIKEKLKNIFQKKEEDGNNKKKIENLVVFLVILIITLIVINVIWNGDKKEDKDKTTDSNKRLADTSIQNNNDNSLTSEKTETNLTNDLEEILSNINGVGKVKVMITYSETSSIVPVYNEESTMENTEETDSEGGTRKVSQTDTRKEVIYEENDGNKTLITQSVISPKIEGAIITAEGAVNPTVKTNIIQAVSAVTGLATHKVQVFEMSN